MKNKVGSRLLDDHKRKLSRLSKDRAGGAGRGLGNPLAYFPFTTHILPGPSAKMFAGFVSFADVTL